MSFTKDILLQIMSFIRDVLYKGHGFKDSKTMSFIKDVPYKGHDL